MDDVITGAKNLDDAIELQEQLTGLLRQGQFRLRKWRSNDQRTLKHLSKQCKTEDLLRIKGQETLKTLGILWNANKDSLQYSVSSSDNHKITKRNVLSRIAKIYDPLGLLGPVLITAKIFMQELWQLKMH